MTTNDYLILIDVKLDNNYVIILYFRNEDCIRIERLSDTNFDYSESLKKVCELFDGDETMTKHVSGLPSDVVGCLGATLGYLAEFKLDRIIKMAG